MLITRKKVPICKKGCSDDELLAYFESLSKEKFIKFLRASLPDDQDYVVENIICDENSKQLYGDKKIQKLPDLSYKNIHQDDVTGIFYCTNEIEDYIENCKDKYEEGGIMREYEIISKMRCQTLFMTVCGKYPVTEIRKLAKDIKIWIDETFKADCTYKVLTDEDNNLVEIRFNNIIINSHEEKMDLLGKFLSEYKGELKYIAKNMLEETMQSNDEPYERAIGIFHKDYEKNGELKLRSKTWNNKFQNEVKDHYNNIKVSRPKDEEIPVVGNIYNITINNTVNVNNMTINHNYCSENTKFMENIEDFINYIIDKKPSWYTSGDLVPKKLFTKMYNDKYGDNKSTRSVMATLKKSILTEKIMYDPNESKTKRINLSEYGITGKTFAAFRAK